jgi:hypothetical protein
MRTLGGKVLETKEIALVAVFFASSSILWDWGELIGSGDVVCFVGDRGFGDLTCEFAGVFEGRKYRGDR